jgi:hypothetical protein
LVTSDDALNTFPPGVPDEASYIIAEEVKDLSFRYFDGTNWQTSWDGTQPGADGSTPMGPPVAIEITLGLAVPQAGKVEPKIQTYRHVVVLPTANNPTPVQITGSGTTSSGSGTTSSSSGSGSQ